MKLNIVNNFLFLLILLALILLFPISSMAVGNSPFSPPGETDSSFVTDIAPKLDQYLKTTGSPIEFDIEIKRYVGDTDLFPTDLFVVGRLADYQKLISNKVISATATLRMPIYDVDDDYTETSYVKEIDKVYINGHYIGLLTSGNEKWKQNSFTIPIEWLNFPEKEVNGKSPTPAKNTVRIDIDTGNNGNPIWAVEIDWAELTFEAMPPVVLIHGNRSDCEVWRKMGFTTALREMNIPFDNSINLPTTTVANNGITLKNEILRVAKEMGLQNIQIIAHSKGGLDTREFLSTHYPDLKQKKQLKVHTLITLSTPHRGSVAADYIDRLRCIGKNNDKYYLENFKSPAVAAAKAYLHTFNEKKNEYDANYNLTTYWTEGFNKKNHLPSDIQYYSVGADADINNDNNLAPNEWEAQAEDWGVIPHQLGGIVMNELYRVTGNYSTVTIKCTNSNSLLNPKSYIPTYKINEIKALYFQENDIIVTVNSAKYQYPFTFIDQFGKTHSSVTDGEVAKSVIKYLKYR